MRNRRINFFLDLIKLAARREDIEALRGILEFKYPGDRRIPGFAVEYYEKFIKGKNIATPLTEKVLPQPLPNTIEELLSLLQSVEVVKGKTKKEEFAENLKSKYPNIDLTNLNEDYLSWLHQRYIENKIKSGEIVHPIEEALVTLRKFTPIQDKYKASPEFRAKLKEADYEDISSVQELTLDEMENIISLDTSGLSVKVEGVETKPEEFLGKFGEWNLWLPHTKETSAKIAGYDENYNPKTTWCTARTKGSNLFYNYIGRKDVPAFLFYIIKDNPSNNKDWLSLGYVSQGNRLTPDFSGIDGGLSVDRANKGLRDRDYSKILGDEWDSIKSKIDTELEKYKIIDGGEERYVSPARSLIEGLAKNVEEFKEELYPKSNEEKKDFIKVIMDAEPSEEVLKVCGKALARIDPYYFLADYTNESWAQPYLGLAANIIAKSNPYIFIDYFLDKPWAKPYIDLAARNAVDKDPYYFINYLLDKPWAQPYLDLVRKRLAENDPKYFLDYFSKEPWAEPYLDLATKNLVEKDPSEFLRIFSGESWAQLYTGLAAKKVAENDPKYFLKYFSHRSWAEPYIDLAASNLTKEDPTFFLDYFSGKPWAKSYIDLAANNLVDNKPIVFLNYFLNKSWAQPYIDRAAKNLAEKDSYYLLHYSDKPWAKPYVDLAAKNCAEKDPRYFILYYSEESWAKPYIELARSKLKARQASNSIQNKLLKLSDFLKSNNLKEYYKINIMTNLYKI